MRRNAEKEHFLGGWSAQNLLAKTHGFDFAYSLATIETL